MSSRSERPKNRRWKLVGGGYSWTRDRNESTGGSLKAKKRQLRKKLKNKRISVDDRRAMKAQLREMIK